MFVPIFYSGNNIFFETRYTSGVKSDVFSVATIGNARITDSGHFFDFLTDQPLLPELCIEVTELRDDVWRVTHHSTELGWCTGYCRTYSGCRGH
jgi:hypothetical protein|tara:strand:+ start:553 stop:834 length:282 start_codon:yes stop_codon:yes gene_type:complete